ncbi:FAD-dependent oxidoreductase [Ancylobacter sp. MQZ15Z-1]|uniref:FAD-dependent oxidoreductase n=1 Tax=Ancylobacter mangrovi TaxID=2972472 RepID=A0A9X2PPZ3_9HYPH|nr:FAD-dependent oxidoreductase [Ancylobacter mangrovi]MCS0497698.1 FAD-dependent oxidoreductase [Ancylobacter mangrovi]
MEMVDVVVVGAGPVGLLTAIELTVHGARVMVLERLAAPSTAMKALSVGALGSEALQRRGMGAALATAEARSLAAIAEFSAQSGTDLAKRASRFSGHFAGLPVRRDPQAEPDRCARMVDQPAVEAMLGERALALGIDLRRGCDVTRVTQQADGVEVEWTSPAGAGHLRCAYLVACDGGRSSIRKMAGFAFPGTTPTLTMYQAIGEIDHPERLLPVGWNRTPGGVFSCGPFPGRLFMLDFSGPPADRDAPVTREEIDVVLRRVSGADVRVRRLESASRWTDHTRLADSYRRGRILLAGDAAHIHPPFGAQGLNLGLVDAANLGWKLAAVLRGDMADALLDSYDDERRPVAEAVLANTRAQVALLRPDPQSGAMRDLFASLMQSDDATRFIAGMMSGLSTHYDLGPGPDELGRLLGDRRIRARTGEFSLHELMADGKWVLLDASGGQEASLLAAAATDGIRCVALEDSPSLLIRSDACVAWVGEAGGIGGLREALRRWFAPVPEAACPEPSRA